MNERPPQRSDAIAAYVAAARPASRAGVRVSWFALLMIGAYTGLLGPALPSLSERTGASLGQTGAVFSALFGAGIIASAAAGRFVDRLGARVPLLAGLLIDAAGLVLLAAAPSLPALLLAGAVIGTGDSAIVVSTHVLVGRLYPGDEAGALNRLNVFFGVGAVLGPALGAAVTLAGASPLVLFLLFALGQAGAVAVLLRCPVTIPPADHPHGRRFQPASCARAGLPCSPCCCWCTSASRSGWARGRSPTHGRPRA